MLNELTAEQHVSPKFEAHAGDLWVKQFDWGWASLRVVRVGMGTVYTKPPLANMHGEGWIGQLGWRKWARNAVKVWGKPA